jgi:hypothetical protein
MTGHSPTQQNEEHPDAKKIAVESEGDSTDNAKAPEVLESVGSTRKERGERNAATAEPPTLQERVTLLESSLKDHELSKKQRTAELAQLFAAWDKLPTAGAALLAKRGHARQDC